VRVAEIGAALAATSAPATPHGAEQVAKQVVEDVADVPEVALETAGPHGLVTELVVLAAFAVVGQHRVRLGGFLELVLRSRVVGIASAS
jgi:hypothetical protein